MKRFIAVALSFILTALVLLPLTASAAVDELKVRKTVLKQPGWIVSAAFGINDRGDVVGLYQTAGPSQGFFYSGGSYMDIMPPGWSSSTPRAVSENGNVVGEGTDGATKGFLYNAGTGTYTTLEPAATWTNVKGHDVNNSGHAVGTGFFGGFERGFLYENGTYAPIPGGYTSIEDIFINNSGHIAGTGFVGGVRESFYLNGALMPIGPPGWTDVSVIGINDSDVVAGNGDDGMSNWCFLYNDGAYETISGPEWFGSQCFALNNRGDVFGWGIKGPTSIIYFIYRDGNYYEVDPGEGYFIPGGFNSSYEIVGYRQAFPFSVDALHMAVLPSPDLTAGGKDGPVGAGPAGSTKLRLSMLAWSFKKLGVEWWVVASTPGGVYSFDPFARSWSHGLTPAVRMPLRDIKPTRFPPAPAAGPGIYTYYLGVDPFSNGRIDPAVFFYDILTIVRR